LDLEKFWRNRTPLGLVLGSKMEMMMKIAILKARK